MIASVPASEPLPLNAVGSAMVAFDLRKVRSDYSGNCVRVRESAGNTLADIGFAADGTIDISALQAHCGANDGFVETWYDQSGGGHNLTQSTQGSQPKIVSAGVVCTNNGKPTIQFRTDYLEASLGSAKANNSITFAFVMQVRTSWHDIVANFASLTGNCLNIWSDDQWFRMQSFAGGGTSSQLGDSTDSWMATLRLQHLICRLNAGDVNLFYNGVNAENPTVANHGATSSTLRIGGATANSDTDISSVVVYDSVLADSQVQSLYNAMNEYYLVGPVDPLPTLSVRDRWHSDSVIRKWISNLTEADLQVTRGNLSWDETYADTDELMRLWLVFAGGLVNFGDDLHGMLSHPVWHMINPDPDGYGGMDHVAGYRTWETEDHGTSAPAWATFYSNSLPKAGDAEGNPYYRQKAVGMRAIIHGGYSLMRFMQAVEGAVSNDRTDFIGGNLMAAAYAFRMCRDAVPLHVQNAYLDLLFRVCQKLWWLRPSTVNSNMTMKAIAGLAQCSVAFGEDTARKTVCVEAAKRILFGSTTGSAATTDKSAGVFSAAGYIGEGESNAISPETTYNGHSFNWAMEAYRVTHGDPDWSFMQDVVNAMTKFKVYQYFVDPDGREDGPSGYAGRTGGSYVFDQGQEAWRDHNAAAATADGRPLTASLPNEATLVDDVNAAITSWNTTRNIDDDCILASGTAAAHTNGSSSTTITLTNSPNLSGLSVSNDNGQLDWRAWLWLDIDGGQWSVLSAFDNTAKTVTTNLTYDIESGSAVDYRIEKGPKGYGTLSTWWPPENYYPVPDGYFDSQRARIDTSDASLETPWQSDNDHNVNFADEFWSYKANDGTRDFGFFIEAIEQPGSYDGWYGGTLQVFWTRDTGMVICSRHDKAGPSPNEQENTRVWAEVDQWATTQVYGIDSSNKGFTSGASDGLQRSVTYSLGGSPPSVVCETFCDAGVTPGFESGTAITGDVTYTQTFEAQSDGLRHLVEVAHSGTDNIKELWATIPVYLRDTSQSMADAVIQYWTGTGWNGLGTTLVNADWIRIGRDFGSGRKYVWIHLAATESVRLSDSIWVQSYQGQSRHRNIKIDLLGYTGSAQSFPATASTDYDITTTDPGLTATAPSISFTYPSSSWVFPEGGVFYIKGEVEWVGSAGTVFADYTTNGTDWTEIGEMTLISGTTYRLIGGTVPASLDAIRIRAVPPSGTTGLSEFPITSAATTLKLNDAFTAADDTVIDSSYTGWATNTTGSTYSVIQGSLKVTSNKAVGTNSAAFGCQVRINAGTARAIVEGKVVAGNTGLSTRAGIGVRVNQYFEQIKAGLIHTGTTDCFKLRVEGNSGGEEVASLGSYANNKTYRIRVQAIEDVVCAQFFDVADGDALVATLSREGLAFYNNVTHHGFTTAINTSGGSVDDFKIWTW